MLFSPTSSDDTNRVRVKICGLMHEDDVVAAVELGADAVGFQCYAGTPRFVTPSRLMSLLSLVPPTVSSVLMFVNPKAEEVREVIGLFPQCMLQFSGQETRAFCDQFHVPYVKSVTLDRPERLLEAEEEYPMAAALLADVPAALWGPAGASFDWEKMREVRQRLQKPLIVAGALREENVLQAVRRFEPWAVDVSAGVETATAGLKSREKMERFFEAVERGGDARA